MSIPNVARDEFPLTLGSRTLTLAPEFDRVAKVEQILGRPLVKLMNELEDGRGLTLVEATDIVHTLCVDADPAPSRSEIGQLVLANGIVSVLPAVGILFSKVLLGGKKSGPKEPRADRRS